VRLAFRTLHSVRAAMSMAPLALLFPVFALARVPAAVVIEVGELETGGLLASCHGVRLQDREVFIPKHLGDQVRGAIAPEKRMHIETGLTQSEEINRIVLLRSRGSCDVFLAAKRLPRPEAVFGKAFRHDLKWSVDQADSVLHLSAGRQSFRVPAGKGIVLGKNGNGIRLHNHGRLALWEKPAATKRVGPDNRLPRSWADVLDAPFLDPEQVRQLIKEGADVNQPEKAGREQKLTYPLAMVIGDSSGSLKTGEMLIRAGAKIDQGDMRGKTALHIAARFGYFRFAEMLLKHGAAMDARDKDRQTPLFNAAYSGSGDIVALLLKFGADVKARDSEGRTALHLLHYTSFTPDPLPVATLLLEFGADVNAHSDIYGSPLHQAVRQEKSELAKFLIGRGANVNAVNLAGNTPAHFAAGYNRTDILSLLMDAGAAPDALNKAHESLLHKAVAGESLEAAEWLLDHGADIEARSDVGMTPLLFASVSASPLNKPAIVQLLLDRGAKIEVQDDQGNTPLSFAEKLNPAIHKLIEQALNRKKGGGQGDEQHIMD